MFCYQKNFTNPTLPVDEQQFYALVRAAKWNEDIDRYRETGEASLKRKLPAFIFQATFDETTSKTGKTGRWRKQAATRLTGLVVMDIDHVENPREVFEGWGLKTTTDDNITTTMTTKTTFSGDKLSPQEDGNRPKVEKLSKLSELSSDKNNELSSEILLVYVTPSGKGLKVVFKADPQKGNLIDNQHAMAKVLGVEVDESCKDASRMSFICKESDILFIDKELFTYENREFAEKYNEQYRSGHTQPTLRFDDAGAVAGGDTRECAVCGVENVSPQDATGMANIKTTTDDIKTTTGTTMTTIKGDNLSPQEKMLSKFSPCERPEVERSKLSLEEKSELSFKWRGYDVQSIIDARYADKLPCKEDRNRHNESLRLASDLLVMLDGDKADVQRLLAAQPWVQELINEGERVETTVSSAAERMQDREKKYISQLPSKAMLEAVRHATGKTYQEITRGTQTQASTAVPSIDLRLKEWGRQIGELIDEFPLLRDICEGLPMMQWPAAIYLASGFLMTLMTRCWYRFYHRPEKKRRLNCSLLVIGDPASGKSVATDLYELLTEPIKTADKAGKKMVNNWKETTEAKGANKDKEVKPKALIRIHPARTSNQTFITDMVNAVEVVDGEEMQLHMLTFDSELDNTLTVQKGGSWINKQAMELKAFHNEEDGQAYSNKGSIQEDFNVTWNYIYTGTPLALKNKVNDKNFGTGLPTRLTVIPMPATNYEMLALTEFSSFDHERQERMRQWAYKLDTMKGELPLWPLVKRLWEWTSRRMDDAREDDSKAEEMLLKRCAYHGLNYSAPFIVMRHWANIHQDGRYWCGTFETDDTDWKLCELLTNIHHACQMHYFMAMAENYFDNQKREGDLTICHQRKTVEGYNRLPEEFTIEDVMQCFSLSNESAARTRTIRLIKDHLAEKTEDYVVNGHSKSKYRKTGNIIV